MPEKDYISNVYAALKDNLEGFGKTEDEFRVAIKEPAYADRVYAALSENLEGFTRTKDDFNEQIGLKKKEQTSPSASKTPSLGYGNAVEAAESTSTSKSTSGSGNGIEPAKNTNFKVTLSGDAPIVAEDNARTLQGLPKLSRAQRYEKAMRFNEDNAKAQLDQLNAIHAGQIPATEEDVAKLKESIEDNVAKAKYFEASIQGNEQLHTAENNSRLVDVGMNQLGSLLSNSVASVARVYANAHPEQFANANAVEEWNRKKAEQQKNQAKYYTEVMDRADGYLGKDVTDIYNEKGLGEAITYSGKKFLESAPMTAYIAGMSAIGLGAIANAQIFGGTSYDKYKENEDRTDMSEEAKVTAAVGYGATELLFEGVLTSGVTSLARDYIKQFGKDAAKKELKKTMFDMVKDVLKKTTPLNEVVFEGVGEGLTQLSQNVIDKYTDPTQKDKDPMEGVINATAIGAVGGGGMALGTSGGALVNKLGNKTKIDEFEAQKTDLFNVSQELSPENAQLVQGDIDKIAAKQNEVISNDRNVLSNNMSEDEREQVKQLSNHLDNINQDLQREDISDQAKEALQPKADVVQKQIDDIYSEAEKKKMYQGSQFMQETGLQPGYYTDEQVTEAKAQINTPQPNIEAERTSLMTELDDIKSKLKEKGHDVSKLVPSILSDAGAWGTPRAFTHKYSVFKNIGDFDDTRWGSTENDKSTKASEILKEIEDNTTDPVIKSVLPILHRNIGKNDVSVLLSKYTSPVYAGLYHSDENVIRLLPAAARDEHTFQQVVVHEILHALTLSSIEQKNPDARTAKFISDISNVFSEAESKAKPGKNGKLDYGFTDVHEFISEVFSNKDFQRKLKDQGVWRNIINSIKEFFGFKTYSEADKVIDIVSGYLDGETNLHKESPNQTVGSPNNDDPDYKRALEIIDRIRALDKSKKSDKFESSNEANEVPQGKEQGTGIEGDRNAEAENVARSVHSTGEEDKGLNETKDGSNKKTDVPGTKRISDFTATREEYLRDQGNNEGEILYSNDGVKLPPIFHGSNTSFDQFDAAHSGSGIGNQAGGFFFITSPSFALKIGENVSQKRGGNPYVYQVAINGNNFLSEKHAPAPKQLQAIGTLNGIDFTKSTAKNGEELFESVAKSFGDWNAEGIDLPEVFNIYKNSTNETAKYLASKGITGKITDTVGEVQIFDGKSIDIESRTKIINDKQENENRKEEKTDKSTDNEPASDAGVPNEPTAQSTDKEVKPGKQSGRSTSYEEKRVPASDAYREFLNSNKVLYTELNLNDNLKTALDFLNTFEDSDKGIEDAYNALNDIFSENPYDHPYSGIAGELLSDRIFGLANEAYKADDMPRFESLSNKSAKLTNKVFNAYTKAGQYNAAASIFSRQNPDAALLFVNGIINKETSSERRQQKRRDVNRRAEETEKDIKKAKKEAIEETIGTITEPKVKPTGKSKFKELAERGNERQKKALAKLKKIGYLGSNGLNNEAIEAIGELVLSQIEKGIGNLDTIIKKIAILTNGKVTREHVEEAYEKYTANLDGKEMTLKEINDQLKQERKGASIDVDKELGKAKNKADSVRLKEEQAAKDKIERDLAQITLQNARQEANEKANLEELLRKEREKIGALRIKEEQAVKDRVEKYKLQRVQQELKESKLRAEEIEKRIKNAGNEDLRGRLSLRQLAEKSMNAGETADALAKEIQEQFNLKDAEGNAIAQRIYKIYETKLRDKVDKVLRKELGVKALTNIEEKAKEGDIKPVERTLGEKITQQVLAGSLDNDILRDAFAFKYGLPVITPLIQNNIRLLASRANEAKTAVSKLEANKRLMQYIQSQMPISRTSVLTSMYYVGLLSGISTAMVNAWANLNLYLNSKPIRFIEDIIDAAKGKAPIRSLKPSDVKTRFMGGMQNIYQSLVGAADIFVRGAGEGKFHTLNEKGLKNFDAERLVIGKNDLKNTFKSIPHFFKSLTKLFYTVPVVVTRNIDALDRGFQTLNFNAEAVRLTRKDLYKKGLRGKNLETEVYKTVYGTKEMQQEAIKEAEIEAAKIGLNPDKNRLFVKRVASEIIQKNLNDEVQAQADEAAKENVLKGKSRGATGYLATKIPQIALITPFISTVLRATEQYMNYIPIYGALRYSGLSITDILRSDILRLSDKVDEAFVKRGIENVKRAGALRNKQLAQVLLSHAILLSLYGLSKIIWHDDEDNKDKPFVEISGGYNGLSYSERMQAEKVMPSYILRIGNIKIPYKYNPLAAPLLLLGTLMDHERTGEQDPSIGSALVEFYSKAMPVFLLESTPVENLNQAFKSYQKFSDPDQEMTFDDFGKEMGKIIANTGGAAIPNSYKQIFDFIDPQQYNADDLREITYRAANMEHIGGLHDKYDYQGREIKYYPGERVFPYQYWAGEVGKDPVDTWLVKNKIKVPNQNKHTLVVDLNEGTNTTMRTFAERNQNEYSKEELSKGGQQIENDLNYRLISQYEWEDMDQTVRKVAFKYVHDNFTHIIDESEYPPEKPFSEMNKREAEEALSELFKNTRLEYIQKKYGIQE